VRFLEDDTIGLIDTSIVELGSVVKAALAGYVSWSKLLIDT